VVLCHLLNTFCLLYGLDAVPISNANLRTLQPTWNVALYKIFRLKSLSNLYYVQYLMGTLPVNYALDFRKLSFQHKQSVHHISVMNLLFSVTAIVRSLNCYVYELLCYSASGSLTVSCLCVACGKHLYVI